MKFSTFITKNLVVTAALAAAAMVLTPSAKANLVFKYASSASGHYSGGSNPSEADIAACLGLTSSQLGSVMSIVNQDRTPFVNFNHAISFVLGWRNFSIRNDGQGDTSGIPTCVVVQDSNNNCYVWDISKYWNGNDQMDFSDICDKGSHITSITCYGDTKTPSATSVPEPGTIVAGALLLLPLGISMTRILRRSKMQAVIK